MQEFGYWYLRHGHYIILVSVLITAYRWRYLNRDLRYIAWFVGVANLGEIVSHVTGRYFHINNLYLFHIYTVLEFNAIALFYWRMFRGFTPRWFIPIVMVVFTAFAVLNSAYIQVVTGVHTYTLVLESLLIIGLALLVYYQMLAELRTTRLDISPVFWINTGFLLYFAGTLFVFMLHNEFVARSNQMLVLITQYIHVTVMILLHVFISIGLWLSPKRQLI